MTSEAGYLRKLEARVRSLEAENKALRAVLDNRNTLSGNSLDEASAEKTPQKEEGLFSRVCERVAGWHLQKAGRSLP